MLVNSYYIAPRITLEFRLECRILIKIHIAILEEFLIKVSEGLPEKSYSSLDTSIILINSMNLFKLQASKLCAQTTQFTKG